MASQCFLYYILVIDQSYTEKLMEQSRSPTGQHGHAGMAEEGAGQLELLRIGGGLSNTAGQRKPLAPLASSDPPPMRSSPRSGGDPDEETDWSKRLRKGRPVHASKVEKETCQLWLLPFGGPSHTVRPRPPAPAPPPPPLPPPTKAPPPLTKGPQLPFPLGHLNTADGTLGHPVRASMGVHFGGRSHTVRPRSPQPQRQAPPLRIPLEHLKPLGHLNRAHATLDKPRPDDCVTEASSDEGQSDCSNYGTPVSSFGLGEDFPQPDDCVYSDEEQSDPSYIGGEGLPSGVETNGGHIVEIVSVMEEQLPRQSKLMEEQLPRRTITSPIEILAGLPSGVETNGGHIVEMVNFMEEQLPRQWKKALVQEEMIYRVLQISSSLDKDAYAPQIVSFGPYHCGTEALWSAAKYKWFFLEQILNMNKDVPLRKYLEEMDGVKQKVQGCYEVDTLTQTEYGLKMLLLDGCCILGFLGILPLPPQEVGAQTQKQDNLVAEASTVRKFISSVKKMLAPHPKQVALAVEAAESKRTADSATITLWRHDSIRHDLLLMENQLPFFVLEKIYELAITGTGTPVELKVQVDRTIQKLLASYPLISITTDQSFHHLLHCCHLKFKPAMANSSSSNSKPTANSSSSNSKPTGELQQWRGATDLYKAGIKFKRKKCGPSQSLLNVELVSGKTLMIPTLIIEGSTRSVFRNLIAFEQTFTDENYFAAYAFFMGELMRTPGDVTLLVKKGVVENYLGADKEVSDFFNNLAFDVHGEHFLSSTFEKLKSSYNNVRNKHMADLRQNYCSSPWLKLSVAAGTIALVCTVVNAVHTLIRW